MTNDNVKNPSTESESNNIAIVKRLYNEVWNDRRTNRISEILSPDLLVHYDQGKIKGINDWKEKLYIPFTKALPDGRIEIDDIVDNGGFVIARWKAGGIQKDILYGVLAAGDMIKFNGITWMRISGGRIVVMWNNWNISYLLQRFLAEINTLRGLLPICATCKKIRDDKGYWNQIESYIQKHSEAEFSHSICPECSDELYGKEDWYIKMKKKKSQEE